MGNPDNMPNTHAPGNCDLEFTYGEPIAPYGLNSRV